MHGMLVLLLSLLVTAALVVVWRAASLRVEYDARLGALEPHGSGGLGKDAAAYALLSLTGLVRRARGQQESQERLHGVGQPSRFFAENFYLYFTLPAGGTDLVLSTRLSLYGVNASHVIPWFTLSWKGQEWNLPEEFEEKCYPHDHVKMQCDAPGIGKLQFQCIVPFKQWQISYEGDLVRAGSGLRRKVNAKFDLGFNPNNVFHYQMNWDPMAAARAMAQKQWDSQFWKELRSQYQERYASQAKKVSGSITFLPTQDQDPAESVEAPQFPSKTGETLEFPVLESSRDHNFGTRNWLYIWRYIWWSPVKFDNPIVIEGIPYTYLTGSFVEYGNTFEDLVVGGLMAEDGHCASFSGSTPMRQIAPEWFSKKSVRNQGIGESTLPRDFHFFIAVLQARYVLEINITRGTLAGLWSHSFMMSDGDFEIHEGQSLWTFTLRRIEDSGHYSPALQVTKSVGLFEFGANLVGLSTES